MIEASLKKGGCHPQISPSGLLPDCCSWDRDQSWVRGDTCPLTPHMGCDVPVGSAAGRVTAKALQRTQAGVSLGKEEISQRWWKLWGGRDCGQEVRTPRLLLQTQTLQGGAGGLRAPGSWGTFGKRYFSITHISSMCCPRSVWSPECASFTTNMRGDLRWPGQGEAGSDLHEAPPPHDGLEAWKGPGPHLQSRRLRRPRPWRVPTMVRAVLLLGLLAYGSGQGPSCILGAPPSWVQGSLSP